MTSCRRIETAISRERDLTEDLIGHADSCPDCSVQLMMHRRLATLWPVVRYELPDPPQVILIEAGRPLQRAGRILLGAWILATILVSGLVVHHASRSLSSDGAMAAVFPFAAIVVAALLALKPMRLLIRGLVVPGWRPD